MNLGWMGSAGALVGLLLTGRAMAAEPTAPTEPQAQLHVQLEPREAALLRRLPGANFGPGATALQLQGYDWVCGGGCELALPPGRHTLALSLDA